MNGGILHKRGATTTEGQKVCASDLMAFCGVPRACAVAQSPECSRSSIVLFSLTLLLRGAAAVAATGDSLLDAAAAGDAAAVRALLKQGQNVNRAGPDGATPLHWAVRADDLETVDALIRAGANVSATNALGVSPIYIAAPARQPAQ